MPKSTEITDVKSLLEIISNSGLSDSYHSHLRVWFRGHSDKSWDLNPGVYRPSFKCKNEDDRLNKEQHLSQDFRVYSISLRKGTEDNSELYFLQQHYGMPTRLLDWSNQPLAALFFAVSGNDDKDGELLLMDAYQLAKNQVIKDKHSKVYTGIATGRSPLFKEAIDPIMQWKSVNDFPNHILPVRPDHFDRRMSLQKSYFTYHVPSKPTLTASENKTLQRYTIPKDAKPSIIKELSLLGIDHFNIYGDMESLARTLKANYKVQ